MLVAPLGATSLSFRTTPAATDPAPPPPLTFLLPDVLPPVPPVLPLPPTTTENLELVGWLEALLPNVPAASGLRRLGEAWRLLKRKDPSEPYK